MGGGYLGFLTPAYEYYSGTQIKKILKTLISHRIFIYWLISRTVTLYVTIPANVYYRYTNSQD